MSVLIRFEWWIKSAVWLFTMRFVPDGKVFTHLAQWSNDVWGFHSYADFEKYRKTGELN